jgi:hypothetical protein
MKNVQKVNRFRSLFRINELQNGFSDFLGDECDDRQL